jgi:SSS family solute:Na+ symporter
VLGRLRPTVLAADGAAGDPALIPRGLVPLDWGILACYAASMLAIGWYCSRQSVSTQEYFVSNRRMHPALVGVSLFVTLLSTISYLSMPGEVLGKGPAYLTRILAYPLAYLAVGFLLLPVYMRQHVTSAYELLETKLGLSVRLLGAVLFIVLRLVWMSLLVYLAAKAMTVMLGVDDTWVPIIVLVMGAITVVYTSMGGIQAVVITDLVQTILLYGGTLLVLALVTIRTGSVNWFPTSWQSHWDHQPLYSFDPATRVSVLGTLVSTLLFSICTAGGDQTSVQRFMSTTDARAARRALAVQLSVATLVSLTLGVIGLALLGYFQQFPEKLPPHLSLSADADDIFPYFIAYQLPPGASGLVVAGMFAAAMSSLDSGVNSITAVVMTDFCDRFGYRPRTERAHLRAAQLLALTIGVLIVLGSSQMDKVPGNITAVTSKTANLLTPTIFCLFFFALFVPFANAKGVWAGAIAGTTAAVLVAFSGPIFGVDPQTGSDPISFQWIAPISMATNLIIGALISLATTTATNPRYAD